MTKGENGWVHFESGRIWYGGKLLATTTYRNFLVDRLIRHQITRLVYNNFCQRQEKLLDRAQKFVSSLDFNFNRTTKYGPGSETSTNCRVGTWNNSPTNTNARYLPLVKFSLLQDVALDETVDIKLIPATATQIITETTNTTITRAPALEIKIAGQVVENTSYWVESMRSSPEFVNPIPDLDVPTIEWILYTFVQAKLIGETLKTIINDVGSQFPTNDDRFDNFDPPFLRGILTQTTTSKRLAEYQENVNSLRTQAMESDASVPTAVVDLMQSYLIV